jgi:hypothetical protein
VKLFLREPLARKLPAGQSPRTQAGFITLLAYVLLIPLHRCP